TARAVRGEVLRRDRAGVDRAVDPDRHGRGPGSVPLLAGRAGDAGRDGRLAHLPRGRGPGPAPPGPGVPRRPRAGAARPGVRQGGRRSLRASAPPRSAYLWPTMRRSVIVTECGREQP